MKKKLIGQGRTAEIFMTEKDKILKLFKEGISQKVVNLEYKINNQLEIIEIPIPRTYGIINIEDRVGIIYEYIEGYSMLNKVLKKPWTIINEAKRMADLHLHIHGFKCEKLPSQRKRLIRDILKVNLLTEDEKESIIEYLNRLGDDNTICHGDFHPDNILITNKGPIIIDWLTGSKGNSKADIVRTLLLLKKGSAPPGMPKHKKILLGIIRTIFCFVYRKRYLKKSNITRSELEKWTLPVAAARLSENLPKEEKEKILKLVKKGLKKWVEI